MTPPIQRFALLALLALPAASPGALAPMVPTLVDVAYGSYADPNQPHSAEKLDLYSHVGATSPQPVLIEAHPGGFSMGGKSSFGEYLPDEDGIDAISKAFDAGFAVVSIDYPLVAQAVLPNGKPNPAFPKNKFPRAAHSVRRAIQFVRSQADAWNLDPGQVFLIGRSAGGNLSLWAAMTKDIAKTKGGNAITSQSSRPNGVVFLSPPTYLDPAHLLLPADEMEITDYFGKKSPAGVAKAQKKSLAASPAWRATHKNGGLKTSAVMAELNAAMPLLGVYSNLVKGDTSSSFTFPVADPHSPAMGLLMQEAFDDYVQATQDPQAGWADFTLMGVTRDNAGPVADDIVAWLKARSGQP